MHQPSSIIMQRAIDIARTNFTTGGHAVGAVVVRDGEIISEAITTVTSELDSTCHAEVNALRLAMKKLQSRSLPGCYLYTTYEPCPMCTSAAIWSKMQGIVYGASREDRNEKYSWRIMIPALEVIERGKPRLELYPEFMRDECKKLLELK